MVVLKSMSVEYHTILDFWFSESMKPHWFAKSDAVDNEIKERFLETYEKAREGEYNHWQEAPRSRLALIILYDQFTRNMFRNTERMFESDLQALQLTQNGIRKGMARDFSLEEKQFFYMPLMHSEDKDVQEQSVQIYEAELNDYIADFARKHRDIIVRFGRYPHRNEILGRESTDEEKLFLAQPNSSF